MELLWRLKRKNVKSAKNHSTEQARLSTADLSVGTRHLEQGRSVNKCAYCGSPDARDRDHVIPASWTGRRTFRDETVISCSDCNKILGDAPVFTIADRAEYILGVITRKKKYSDIANFPDWSEDEMEEMDDSFAESIRAGIFLREELKGRMGVLMEVAGSSVYSTGGYISDRDCRELVFEFAHTPGAPKKVIMNLTGRYGLTDCQVKEVLNGQQGERAWVMLKTLYSLDINTSNSKCRRSIISIKGSKYDAYDCSTNVQKARTGR